MNVLESLGLGFKTFAIGLIIVFVVLILIIAMAKLLKPLAEGIQSVSYKKAQGKQKRQMRRAEKKQARVESQVAPVPKQVQPAESQVVEAVPTQQDDLEMIAVLTAAVACAMGKEPGYVVVRSFRRIPSAGSAWSSTSKRESIFNHF